MINRMLWLSIVSAALAFGASGRMSAQTTATRAVMHEKLELSHHVLEAVMTSDYAALERDARALARVTEKPGWMVLTTPEYVRYSGAFTSAVHELVAAAADRDLDNAAVRYTAMTMACYQCHRYVKNARIARR